MYSIYIKKKL